MIISRKSPCSDGVEYFIDYGKYPILHRIGEWIIQNPHFRVLSYEIDADMRGASGKPYTQRGENFALWVKFDPAYSSDEHFREVYRVYTTIKFHGTLEQIAKSHGNNKPLFLKTGEKAQIDPDFAKKCKEYLRDLSSYVSELPEWVSMLWLSRLDDERRAETLSKLVEPGMPVRFNEIYFHYGNNYNPQKDEIWLCEEIDSKGVCTLVREGGRKYFIHRHWLEPANISSKVEGKSVSKNLIRLYERIKDDIDYILRQRPEDGDRWALDVSDDDLHHVHICLAKDIRDAPISIDELINKPIVLLYHSKELFDYNKKHNWPREFVDTKRNIVHYPDGRWEALDDRNGKGLSPSQLGLKEIITIYFTRNWYSLFEHPINLETCAQVGEYFFGVYDSSKI